MIRSSSRSGIIYFFVLRVQRWNVIFMFDVVFCSFESWSRAVQSTVQDDLASLFIGLTFFFGKSDAPIRWMRRCAQAENRTGSNPMHRIGSNHHIGRIFYRRRSRSQKWNARIEYLQNEFGMAALIMTEIATELAGKETSPFGLPQSERREADAYTHQKFVF